MASTLIIILIIILLIMSLNNITIKITRKKPLSAKSPTVEEFEKANSTIPPHLLHYIAGHKNAIALVKIAIYKMYLDGELLNCESLIIGIHKNLEKFSDQKLVDRLVHEFESYMKKLETMNTGIGTGEQGQPPAPGIPGIPGINGE